jgi:putative NADH-flavin reductase
MIKPLIRRVFAGYPDLVRMESVIRKHPELDWTIVRPPQLTDKRPVGNYQTAVNRAIRQGYQITRADLATAILRFLDDPKTIHAEVAVAN